MVSSLLILNSSFCGSRDLWWCDSPQATKGYSVFRSHDIPNPTQPDQAKWEKLNTYPIPAHFYRDQTILQSITYTVQPTDFVDFQQMGKFGIKLPETAYSSVVQGRPTIANSPDDVTVIIDGTSYRPAEVNGMDQVVWLKMDNS